MSATTPIFYRFGDWVLQAALGFYFSRIERFHGERGPRTGPVLFTSNHPSSITDAFVISASVPREYLGRDGQWNPRRGGPQVKGGFQINVFSRREHYLRLARFFRRLAERDTSGDGEYHEHFAGLMSADGTVRLHVILRKDDVGDSGCQVFFPNPRAKKKRKAKTP